MLAVSQKRRLLSHRRVMERKFLWRTLLNATGAGWYIRLLFTCIFYRRDGGMKPCIYILSSLYLLLSGLRSCCAGHMASINQYPHSSVQIMAANLVIDFIILAFYPCRHDSPATSPFETSLIKYNATGSPGLQTGYYGRVLIQPSRRQRLSYLAS